MRTACLLLILACLATTAESQIIYPNLTIPKITGKLLNLSADEPKNLSITYTLITPFS
jgi:hypothetical protein